SVIESELFGHEAGAFTGAHKQRIGKLEYAAGGTLFLDEIESMSASVQVRLLRVLQERTLERVGSNEQVPVDIRVIAASKIDLREAASTGSFREDLLYRLQVAQVSLPPLRDRLDDVPLLFSHFLNQAGARYRRPIPQVEADKVRQLLSLNWPGNVRELRNAAERFVLGLADPHGVETLLSENQNHSLGERLALFERATIAGALREHDGRVGATATTLGLPRKTLYLRMQKYGLEREDFA
ncbi:MAG: sigma-54-dependent Fis family transcriptional regulator, partial [Magnetovibrio sp.]|nr:sigma-54-dependent Fis family transcriptional regulator [Magnetovibrio sp.]